MAHVVIITLSLLPTESTFSVIVLAVEILRMIAIEILISNPDCEYEISLQCTLGNLGGSDGHLF